MANGNALKFLLDSLESGGPVSWNAFKRNQDVVDLTEADLSHRQLADYNLSRVDLSGAKLFNADLSGADLSGAILTYADLRRVNLANAYLTGANLSASNLQGANLVDTNLDNAILTGARMGGAYCVGASMMEANLQNTDLRGANIKFVNLHGAKLRGANVEDADLTNVELSSEAVKALVNYDRAIVQTRRQTLGNNGSRKKLPPEENYDELFREEDCHKILGIDREASIEDVTKAYRKRVKEYHPDRVAHLGEKLQYVAQREFTRVQHAYHSLTAHMSNPIVNIRVKSGSKVSEKQAKDFTIEDYIEMIKWQPNSDVLHYNLGVKYLEKGLIELAIKAYQKSLDLNPGNENAQHNLRLAKLMQTLER